MKHIFLLSFLLPIIAFAKDEFFILKKIPGHLNGTFVVYAQRTSEEGTTFDTSFSKSVSLENPNHLIESSEGKEKATAYDVVVVSSKEMEGIYYRLVNMEDTRRSIADIQCVNPHLVVLTINGSNGTERRTLYMLPEATHASWICQFGKKETIEILRGRFLKDLEPK